MLKAEADCYHDFGAAERTNTDVDWGVLSMTTRRYVILGGIATALFESAVPAGQVFGARSGASDPTASNAGRKSLAAGPAQNVVLIPYGTGTSFTLNTTNLPGYTGLLDEIECIGGGGAGLASMSASTNCPGGGGGAYALSTAIEIPLGTTVTIQIGAGGSASGAAGTDTWFGGANLVTSLCGAKGGTGATYASGGMGGAASSCVFSGSGSIAYSGGNGGPVGGQGSSGGGGAGGPLGAGGAGGAGNATTLAGGGGGGNGGGRAGSSSTSINGGAGGSHSGGTGGGAAGTPTEAATAGSDGGGGGGAASEGPGTGANGSQGNEWTLTAGGTAGSGGGGGAGVSSLVSGNGAVGGGGGAGGGVSNTGFGTGGAGFIVLTYTPASDGSAFVPVSGAFTLSAPGPRFRRHAWLAAKHVRTRRYLRVPNDLPGRGGHYGDVDGQFRDLVERHAGEWYQLPEHSICVWRSPRNRSDDKLPGTHYRSRCLCRGNSRHISAKHFFSADHVGARRPLQLRPDGECYRRYRQSCVGTGSNLVATRSDFANPRPVVFVSWHEHLRVAQCRFQPAEHEVHAHHGRSRRLEPRHRVP